MAKCNSIISMGLENTCSSSPARGYEPELILLNRADIDFSEVTYSQTHKNVLTALALLTGKKGYLVETSGTNPFQGGNDSAEVGTYATTVTKTVVIPSLRNDRDIAEKFADPALNGEFVAILKRKDRGLDGNSAFEVIGLETGARLSEYAGDAYGDTFGGALFTFTESGASKTRIFLGETYAAGKTLWDSLLEAAE